MSLDQQVERGNGPQLIISEQLPGLELSEEVGTVDLSVIVSVLRRAGELVVVA